MTVSANNSRLSYNGNGATVAFAAPYFLANTDLKVYVGGVLKTLTTDYSVSGAGVSSGGTVTFVTAPPTGTGNVVILRDPDQLQATQLPSNDPFPSKAVETAMDKLTMLIQRTRDLLSRAITVPDEVTLTASMPSPEANKFLGWGPTASSIVNLAGTAVGDALSVLFAKPDGTTTTVAANMREKLTASRTYYVRTDGSDSNTGLANTAGGAFKTIQAAVDTVSKKIDLNGQSVIIQVADGTYTAGAFISGPWVGSGAVYIFGNTATPENCIINATSADVFYADKGAAVDVRGFTGTTTTSGSVIKAYLGAYISFQSIVFGSCAASHVDCGTSATVIASGNYSITGGAVSHLHCGAPGAIVHNPGITVTLTGTPAFSAYFVGAAEGSVTCMSTTWTGAATGQKFLAHKGGVIDVGNGNASTLPGNVSGWTENGGVYSDVSGNKMCVWSYNATVQDGINNQNAGAAALAQYVLVTNAGSIHVGMQSVAGGGLALLQSTPTTGMWVGTTNSKYLALLTNNAVAAIISPEQNVGIGRNPNTRSSGGNLEVNGNLATGTPITLTGITTRTVGDSESSFIIACSATLTLTLPNAATFPGRWIYLVNQAAFTVVSNASNVIPLAGGAAGTAILAAAAGKFAWLQSNGSTWSIMAAN